MAMAISCAWHLGLRSFSVPTAGNAGVAAAAYVQAAGGTLDVFMPADSDPAFFDAVTGYGARLHRVGGLISDCGREARACVAAGAWDLSTLKEPYRLEGKKTMGFELWEQLGGQLPNVIIYPTGGGTGLVGMWKAFAELRQVGLISGSLPRMVSVQMAGCAPMVRAFQEGHDTATPWQAAKTDVSGLRVPGAVGDFLILRALRESGGTAVQVSEEDAFSDTALLNRELTIDAAPEAGAAWAGFRALRSSGWIKDSDRVVVFLTGSGALYRNILTHHGVTEFFTVEGRPS
jgi:threonine synthase